MDDNCRTANYSKTTVPALDFPSEIEALFVDIMQLESSRFPWPNLGQILQGNPRDALELPSLSLSILTLSGFTFHRTSLISLPQSPIV